MAPPLAGSVFTPQDCTTNVQRRLGNRAHTGFGQCRPRGSFLDSHLERGETCRTAEATLRWCSRRFGRINLLIQESPQSAEDSQKGNPGRLIFSLPLLFRDAARLWTCVWHPPLQQQQPEGRQHKQP